MTANAFKWKLVGAFAALYLIWGSTYLAIRFALETLPPFTMAGARFVVAGMMLYGWARLRGAASPRSLAAAPRQRRCGLGRTIIGVGNDCALDRY